MSKLFQKFCEILVPTQIPTQKFDCEFGRQGRPAWSYFIVNVTNVRPASGFEFDMPALRHGWTTFYGSLTALPRNKMVHAGQYKYHMDLFDLNFERSIS